jgi:hypothetical protein
MVCRRLRPWPLRRSFPRSLGYRVAAGVAGQSPIFPLGPPSLGPPSPRGPLLRGLVAAPPSSLVRPQLPDSAPLPDFPFAVIRRALPCGCILAGLSPSPFHRCSFPTCNALRPRGARRPLTPSSSPPVTAFTSSRLGSALPLSTLCSGWPLLEAESHSPLDCSPPGQTRPGVAPGRRDFLLRSFRSMSHLLRTSGMTTAPYWE